MDLFKIIQDLYEEKKRIDRVIGALEELATGKVSAATLETVASAPQKKRRGRPRKLSPPPTS